MLDNATYFWPVQAELDLPFQIAASFTRFVPFILPSNIRFLPRYRGVKIAPSSNALPSIIAIVQVILSIRELSVQYGLSISDKGLSSPYLMVIPYILMSLVNLVANILVGSYRRVTMIPMKDKLPEFNEVYIVNCLRKECKGKPSCSHLHATRVLSKVSGIISVELTSTGTPETRTQSDDKQAATTAFEGFSSDNII